MTALLFLLGMSQAQNIFPCGGLIKLRERSDALTQLIYTQNHPEYGAIGTDGVAEPKNWFDTHTQVFHYFRAITVNDQPVATFELSYSLKGGGCMLQSVQAL